MLRPLENRPLFIREDEVVSFTPKFSEHEINAMLHIYSEEYSIPLGAGGKGKRYWLELPCGHMQICRVEPEMDFYGDGVQLVNEFRKEHPNDPMSAWVSANARELNAAKHYWAAENARKKAELNRLRANLAAAEANAYATGKWGLTEEERKQLVLEYGYDPEQSYGF